MPREYRSWMRGWLDRHPGWEHTLWAYRTRPALRNEEAFRSTISQAQRADIPRQYRIDVRQTEQAIEQLVGPQVTESLDVKSGFRFLAYRLS